MSKFNRTELQAENSSKLVPAITQPILLSQQNNAVAASVVMKKDVKSTITATNSSASISFLNSDTIILNSIITDFDILIADLADGEIVHLEINKQLGNEISFTGATLDQTISKGYVTASMTKVIYSITQKNGVVYANAITQNLHEASEIELIAGIANKYITPEKLQAKTWLEVGNDGGLTTLAAQWNISTSHVYYRKNETGAYEFWIKALYATTTTTSNVITDFTSVFQNPFTKVVGQALFNNGADSAMIYLDTHERLVLANDGLSFNAGEAISGQGITIGDNLV